MQTIFFWTLLIRHITQTFHANHSLRPQQVASPQPTAAGTSATPVARAVLGSALPSIELSTADLAQVPNDNSLQFEPCILKGFVAPNCVQHLQNAKALMCAT